MKGRKPAEITRDIVRGTVRLLYARGYVSLLEAPLGNRRRADIVAVHGTGDVVIVEVKSGLSDFRGDHKWQDYLAFCDRFYFAVDGAFPIKRLRAPKVQSKGAGVIVADSHDGEVMVEGSKQPMQGQRRAHLMRRLARIGAQRLTIPLISDTEPPTQPTGSGETGLLL